MALQNDHAFVIRKYGYRDRPVVRRICCDTAFMGEPSAIFFDDDEIFADALTSYFTDCEPESCFVAECDKKIVGYLLGAKDVKRMDKIFAVKIAAPLLIKALRRGALIKKKNTKFLLRVLLSLAKGEFKIPDFLKEYPATLHINIVKEYRMAGIGSKLIDAYMDYLTSQDVKGVHFATMSDKAGRFFGKLKFQLLFKTERSYFRHLLNKNITISIYGRRILGYTLQNKG